jgi:hypothetical protein
MFLAWEFVFTLIGPIPLKAHPYLGCMHALKPVSSIKMMSADMLITCNILKKSFLVCITT